MDNMVVISQATFSIAFSWMKIFVFRFEFEWSFRKDPIDNKSAFVQMSKSIDAHKWH